MLNTGGRAKTYENLNKSANEFIQATARRRIKKFQDQISQMDTRSNKPQQAKDLIIEKANEGIIRMDKIITKKSNVGRPRTRSGQEQEEAGAGLSMASTMVAMIPRKK